MKLIVADFAAPGGHRLHALKISRINQTGDVLPAHPAPPNRTTRPEPAVESKQFSFFKSLWLKDTIRDLFPTWKFPRYDCSDHG
jgi:hypothetical protein